MPAMIRAGGKMCGADGKLKDTKAVNPESTFSRIYQEMINFCKDHGQFDPTTMGTVPNVGLMAQQAEEHGSPTKTLRGPRRTAPPTSSTSTPASAHADGGGRRHLADARRQGRPDSRLGRSWPSPGRGRRVCRWCSGSTTAAHENELRKKVAPT